MTWKAYSLMARAIKRWRRIWTKLKTPRCVAFKRIRLVEKVETEGRAHGNKEDISCVGYILQGRIWAYLPSEEKE